MDDLSSAVQHATMHVYSKINDCAHMPQTNEDTLIYGQWNGRTVHVTNTSISTVIYRISGVMFPLSLDVRCRIRVTKLLPFLIC